MARIKIGHFEADAGLIYLPLGFIPDYFRLIAKGASSTNAIVYEWFEELEDHDSLDGWSFTDGVDAEIAAASGIAAYDSGSQLPTIGVWRASQTALLEKTAGGSITIAARSATAHGTYCIGTTSGTDEDGGVVDRDAIFECVTAGTTDATEPSWPVELGGQVTDNSCVWERVNVALLRGGYQGVRLAASMTGLANGDEGYYLAVQADSVVDEGDVDGWVGGIKGA